MPHHAIRRSQPAGQVVILFLIILLLSPSGRALADEAPAAVVIDVAGPVRSIAPNDQVRDLVKGDIVPGGYTIDCGLGGHAVLEIERGDRAEISENSQIQVGELFAPEENRFSLGLLLGRLTMILKKRRGDDLVVTPTFVCGVRGTRFSVGVADDGASVVTVFQGSVDVSLDQTATNLQGKDLVSRRIDAGQEIVAESPDDTLTPRPATIQNLEDWRSFRQKRLKMMIPRLPQTIALFDRRIDDEIKALEHIAALIKSHTAQLTEQIEAVQTRQRPQRGRFRSQARNLIQEVKTLRRQIQGFRRHIIRLRTIFARASSLQEKLPALKDQIGPEYPDLEQALVRIQERKVPTHTKVRALISELKAGLKPLAPIWNRLKKARQP